MGLMIEDGSGRGYQVKVDASNRLFVYAISESLEHHANIIHGQSYNLLFSQTPGGPGDCFVYMKNLSDDDIILEGITLYVPTDETIEIKVGDVGTPLNGSDLAPVNLNAGSNNEAEGTFQGGNNITGLAGGASLFKFFIDGGGSSDFFNFDQDIILPKNRVLTLYSTNGSIQIDGFLSFFYHGLI
jgi:hypothetical protein